MGTFNVVHIQPLNDRTTQGHWDVARLLCFALQSLGHRATLQTNVFDQQALNIIVGYERLTVEAIPQNASYIPYQLEQLAEGGVPLTPYMRQVLHGAREIWDYSPQNLPVLQREGLAAPGRVKLLPLGYHEAMATIAPKSEEDIDVLFYGLLNDRRLQLLEKIAAQCRVHALVHVYGLERNSWIARSKLVVNIHFYSALVAEQVRVSYLLNNRRCVVTEASHFDPLADCCAAVPYEQIVETCLQLVRDRAARERLIAEGFERFRQRPMTEFLRQVLS